MYKGDYNSGQTVYHIFHCETVLDPSDIRIMGSGHKRDQNGVTLQENYLQEKGLYRLLINTADPFFGSNDYFVLLLNRPLFEFSIENRCMRGTDGANTVVPDAKDALVHIFADLSKTLEGILVLLNTRAPAGEYDEVLDVKISSRSPFGEYNEQFDTMLSSLSPKGEYLDMLDAIKDDMVVVEDYDANYTTLSESIELAFINLAAQASAIERMLSGGDVAETTRIIREMDTRLPEGLEELCETVKPIGESWVEVLKNISSFISYQEWRANG